MRHVLKPNAARHGLSLHRKGMHIAGQTRHRHLTRSTPIHRNGFWHHKFGASKVAGHFRHGSRHHGHHHRHHGFFWSGAMFWPYAYGDIFSYALWPYDYDDAFWDYGPDLIVGGAFWPYGELAYDADGYDILPYANYDAYSSSRRSRTAARQRQLMANACDGFAPGVTDLPLDSFTKIVNPDETQRAALDDLRAQSANAAAIMKQSCSSEIPLTPMARLDAVEKRFQAMDKAVQMLRGPLETFYGLLSSEQKQRLDKAAGTQAARNRKADAGQLCTSAGRGLTDVPVARIEKTITLDDTQRRELDKLKAASASAAEAMKLSCPSTLPASPGARLDAAGKRVAALLQAINTVRPAVSSFYGSLTDEQKARFNTMGQSRDSAANAP